MGSWIRKWLPGVIALVVLYYGGMWFVQQTPSYQALEEMLHKHPVVRDEIGQVISIKLPLSGVGVDWTDAQLNPNYDVQVLGSEGEAVVHAEFRAGKMTEAWMNPASGVSVPLIVRK